MNWTRLRNTAVVALLISFVVGAVISPPDPRSQVLYAGVLFLATAPLVYRYWP